MIDNRQVGALGRERADMQFVDDPIVDVRAAATLRQSSEKSKDR